MASGLLQYTRTNDGKGFKQNTYAGDYVFRGRAFSVSQTFDIAQSGTLYVLFDISKLEKNLVLYPPSFASYGGGATIDVYVGTDYTGGTDMLEQNRSYRGGKNQCDLKSEPTGSNKGTLFTQFLVPGAFRTGGTSADELEFEPPVNLGNYLLEITNLEGSQGIKFNISFVWFE